MATEKQPTATEAADWQVVKTYVERQGVPVDVQLALERLQDPEKRKQAEEEHAAEVKASEAKGKTESKSAGKGKGED